MQRASGYGLQALIFRKTPTRDDPAWSLDDIDRYLSAYDIHPIKPMHETANFYRYRISDPRLYKKIYTQKVAPGLLAIVGVI